MYKDIAKDISTFTIELPKTIIPNPSDEDYSLGFIYRYFVQKANDNNSFIYEVSDEDYQKYLKNPFWKTLKIKWRIAGPTQSMYNDGSLYDMGVQNSNKASLSFVSSDFKNISLYLPNLLQFYKG